MRKYFYILLCTLFVLTATFGPAFAADMDDVAAGSPYDITIKAKIKVKKAGGDKTISSGDVLITADTPTTGDFDLVDDGNPIETITGTLTLLKGKKVTFVVDAAGLDVIEETIINWVTNLAAAQGVTVISADVVFDLPVKPGKFKVDKNTGIPKGKAKLKLKGRINAETDMGDESRKFKYQVIVEF